MVSSTPEKDLRIRSLTLADQDGAVACLTRNFPARSAEYWRAGWRRMERRDVPDGQERFGHCLYVNGAVKGVVLSFFASRGDAGAKRVVANVSSWCVDFALRRHAVRLAIVATSGEGVSFVNISPAPHTIKSMRAQGFLPINAGQMIFAPALSRRRFDARAQVFTADSPAARRLPAWEHRLLADHVALGCRGIVVETGRGVFGFVTSRERLLRGRLPCDRIIYLRSRRALTLCAGAIGRDIALRSTPLMIVDAHGPVPGLVGKFAQGRELKFYKGPFAPTLGDLAYSELVYFERAPGFDDRT